MSSKLVRCILLFITVTVKVPFTVKYKFETLKARFGAIFIRSFEIIREKDLHVTALKMFLSAAFRDTRDQVSKLESMDQLKKFLFTHSSFTDFPMLEGLAAYFGLEEVDKELVSFTEYKFNMYGQLLAEDFEPFGINQLVKDFQIEVSCGLN